MKLFFRRTFCCQCLITETKAEKVISKGEEMLDNEFNIIKIIKNLRDLKLLLKEQGKMTKETKIKIQNSGKSIIAISDSESSSSDEEENISRYGPSSVSL